MKKYLNEYEWESMLSKRAFDIANASDPIRLYEENGRIYSDGLFKGNSWDSLEEAVESIEFYLTDGMDEE